MSGEEGKMFVGGLSKLTNQQSMFNYFSRFGDVAECIVMRDPNTDQSRGFGFVTFREPTSVESVLAAAPHILDGKQIDPKRCNPKQAAANRAAGNSGMNMNRMQGGGGMGGMGGDRDGRLSKKVSVFVGGLPKEAKDTDVREFFSMFGRVTEAVVVVNPENRQSRCFGFVSFDSPDPVNHLTQMRFVDFKGKQVEIKCAEPREPSGNVASPQTRGPSGRGRGMGGGMGNGDGGNNMTPWGMSAATAAAGLAGPGAAAAIGQYPNYGPMAPTPWAAQQWAAMGWNPAAYQSSSAQGYAAPGMYGMGMPGATTGMTMPMAGMNMAGMNMAGMTGAMPMPVGPPSTGTDGTQAPNYGGFNMNNAAGDASGYGQKSGEEYGRQDRNSYHPYKR